MRARSIAWIGHPYYAEDMRRLGWEMACISLDGVRQVDYAAIAEAAGFEPEVVVLGDESGPPSLLGVERLPCLTLFISVDSHIHSWHPVYAQAFDCCAVSLRDHLPSFRQGLLAADRLLWSPAYAKNDDAPLPADKDWDLAFVGTVDPATTPARARLLDELGRRAPGLVVRRGFYPPLYARAKVVLNIAERGDLNFRVFEALGCGACLLTPRVGHGQDELFQEGRDLEVYTDLDELMAKAERLIADEPTRRAMAASGLARVDAGHRARHRAAALDRFLRQALERDLPSIRLPQAEALRQGVLRLLYLHWAESLGASPAAAAYLREASRRPGRKFG